MDSPDDPLNSIVLPCPACQTRVAVPSVARGRMAKCVKCAETFRIPLEDTPIDEDHADDIAIQVLAEAGADDEETQSLENIFDESPVAPEEEDTTRLPAVDAESPESPEDEPPDIGDARTPENVKQLRRERHRLLLEVGRTAQGEVLSPGFDQFVARIKKIGKGARRISAWLEAVERATSDDNPLAKRMDMNVDPSKAAKQLVELERDHRHAQRVLGEALVHTGQHAAICPEQRDRIKAIDAELETLIPTPAKRKGLLSRFRDD